MFLTFHDQINQAYLQKATPTEHLFDNNSNFLLMNMDNLQE